MSKKNNIHLVLLLTYIRRRNKINFKEFAIVASYRTHRNNFKCKSELHTHAQWKACSIRPTTRRHFSSHTFITGSNMRILWAKCLCRMLKLNVWTSDFQNRFPVAFHSPDTSIYVHHVFMHNRYIASKQTFWAELYLGACKNGTWATIENNMHMKCCLVSASLRTRVLETVPRIEAD